MVIWGFELLKGAITKSGSPKCSMQSIKINDKTGAWWLPYSTWQLINRAELLVLYKSLWFTAPA